MGASASASTMSSTHLPQSTTVTVPLPSPLPAPSTTLISAASSVSSSVAMVSAQNASDSSSPTQSDSDSSSLTGALARAGTAVVQVVSRVGSSLFRSPIKVFRQNKFDLAEGHQPVLQHHHHQHHSEHSTKSHNSNVIISSKKSKPPSALKVLLTTQGRSSTLLKQVLPSLIANVAVGSVMFKTFDTTIEYFAQQRALGLIPAWMCSSCLSNGNLPLHQSSSSSSSSNAQQVSFNFSTYIGLDVVIAGCLSGAAQSLLVVPMENSSSWIRQKYWLLEHRMQSHTSSVATSFKSHSHVSAATLEATAMNFIPPTANTATATTTASSSTMNIANMNLVNSIREMVSKRAPAALFPIATTASTAASTASMTTSTIQPPSTLFSNLSFRLTRDAVGLSIFFYVFEQIHASMKFVPFRWLDMQEQRHTSTVTPSTSTTTTRTTVSSSSSISSPSSLLTPSYTELGTFLAWDCLSVVTAGVLAGYSYHMSSWPFFQVLQQIEIKQLQHLIHTPSIPMHTHDVSAWRHMRGMIRTQGIQSIFKGVFGEKSSSTNQTAKVSTTHVKSAPKLFNPLVLGLVVYTLTKTENQSHQIQTWRQQRRVKHEFV